MATQLSTQPQAVKDTQSPSQKSGYAGELYALEYLLQHHFERVTTNYRSRYGEIDLIVSKDKLLVFVEVKVRKKTQLNTSISAALLAVTPSKQRKIMATAQMFLAEHPQFEAMDCRFDVVALTLGKNNTLSVEDWIEAAFTLA